MESMEEMEWKSKAEIAAGMQHRQRDECKYAND
jgi:hypothetical protein